jgi:5-methylcytosine-specific restriction endonuclease McrA
MLHVPKWANFYLHPEFDPTTRTTFMEIDHELAIAQGIHYRTPPWYAHNHLPRKKALIPAELRWAVWERDNFTCKRCQHRQHLSVDHIKPESLGGLTVLENLQTLCRRCNAKKGARYGF